MQSNSNAYSFSEADRKLLADSFAAVGVRKGVEVALRYGSAKTYAGVTVEVVRPKATSLSPVAHIQSVPFDEQVLFSPMSFGDNDPLGPQLAYSTLAEAVKYAAIFVGAAIDVGREGGLGSGPVLPQASSASGDKVLTSLETVLLEGLANEIGKLARASGFVHFSDGYVPGAASASVGYYHKGKPVPLGTFVVSRIDGETQCSVRGIGQGSKLPGPDYYPSVSDAVQGSVNYFAFMTTRTSAELKKPWWKRLF